MCPDLQPTLNATVSEDAVVIKEGLDCPGTIVLPAHPITLTGQGAGATIRGSHPPGSARALFGNNVGETTISNLTFRDGFEPAGHGGGVELVGDSPVTIERCTFLNNYAILGGGGLDIRLALSATKKVTLRDNVFGAAGAGNSTANNGAGLVVTTPKNVELSGNRFTRNSAGEAGGGAFIDAAVIALASNVFSDNLAGGGLWVGTPLVLTDSGSEYARNIGVGFGMGFVGALAVASSTFTANTSAGIDASGAGTIGPGNTITSNQGEGVRVRATFDLKIVGNSISANGALGIDALADGMVTPNDLPDADGAQNYPVLTSAVSNGGQTTVAGTLATNPNKAYAIEIFSSPSCDPTGYGEGERLVASTQVTTDANGSAAFSTTFSPALDATRVVTATATNSTSEFSACKAVQVSAPPPAATPPPPAPKRVCRVPNLKGKTLVRARRALLTAHCRLGKVMRAYSRRVKRGRVISQSVRPRATRPAGARIGVRLSRGKRRR